MDVSGENVMISVIINCKILDVGKDSTYETLPSSAQYTYEEAVMYRGLSVS